MNFKSKKHKLAVMNYKSRLNLGLPILNILNLGLPWFLGEIWRPPQWPAMARSTTTDGCNVKRWQKPNPKRHGSDGLKMWDTSQIDPISMEYPAW